MLKNGSRAVVGMVGSSRDITVRKRAQERIRNDKEEWEQTFDAKPDIVDRDKRNRTLIYADLGDMKKINDNFGHKEGDPALVDEAQILRKPSVNRTPWDE